MSEGRIVAKQAAGGAPEAAAESPFYAQFAKLLRTFIAGEKSEIVDRLSKIDGKSRRP